MFLRQSAAYAAIAEFVTQVLGGVTPLWCPITTLSVWSSEIKMGVLRQHVAC